MNFKLTAIVAFAVVIAAGYEIFHRVVDSSDEELADQIDPQLPNTAAGDDTPPNQDFPDNTVVDTGRSEQGAGGNEPLVHEYEVDGPKWPVGIENSIFDYFSQLEGLEFVAISSVDCEPQTCVIVFSGTNANPQIVDDYREVLHGLYRPPVNARQGSLGTREIAAGAREFVINISSIPYEAPGDEQ